MNDRVCKLAEENVASNENQDPKLVIMVRVSFCVCDAKTSIRSKMMFQKYVCE
jgi:hypothetical protein